MEQIFVDEDAFRGKETIMGAIIGDIVGSRFEFNPIKSKDFEFFNNGDKFTDDTVMTVAIAQSLLEYKAKSGDLSGLAIKNMKAYGKRYPHAGYGGKFRKWLAQPLAEPYGSFGNGSAMRISALAYAAQDLEELHELVDKVTVVTHNHPEGIRGAQAVAAAIFMARMGKSKEDIQEYIEDKYVYDLNRTVEDIVEDGYSFDSTCQGSVPEAIIAFLDGENYEDVIRKAIYLGGDADTQAAIAGSIAEAFYKLPNHVHIYVNKYVDEPLLEIINKFNDFCNE